MIAETTVVGIDVSSDWLDGFCLPGQNRFRHPNTKEGHTALITMIRQIPGQVKVGFEVTNIFAPKQKRGGAKAPSLLKLGLKD